MATPTRCRSCSTSATARSSSTRAPTRITPTLRGGATSAARCAHNTVGIDGAGPVGAGRQFHVDAITRSARCIEFEAGPERQRFVGEHYGYQRLADPVVAPARDRLRRAAGSSSKSPTCCAVTASTTRGAAWHFAEDCQVERSRQRPQGHCRRRAGVFRAAGDARQRRRSIAVAAPEQGGWMSRSFGRKQPCTTVHWHSRITGVTGAAHAHHATRGHAPVGL